MSVCLSLFANCRSQFLLDRLGRYLKLFALTVIPFCHEFASLLRIAIFYRRKAPKNYRENRVAAQVLSWMNQRATRQKGAVTPVTVGRSPATCRNGDNMNDDNCDHSSDRLSRNVEKATSQNGDKRYRHGLKKIGLWIICYVGHAFCGM